MTYLAIILYCTLAFGIHGGEGEYNLGEGLTLVGPLGTGEQAAIGWKFNKDTDTFTPPDPME